MKLNIKTLFFLLLVCFAACSKFREQLKTNNLKEIDCKDKFLGPICDKLALKIEKAVKVDYDKKYIKFSANTAKIPKVGDILKPLPKPFQVLAEKIGVNEIGLAAASLEADWNKDVIGKASATISIVGSSGVTFDLLALREEKGKEWYFYLFMGAKWSLVTNMIAKFRGKPVEEDSLFRCVAEDSSATAYLASNYVDFTDEMKKYKPKDVDIVKQSGPHVVLQTSMKFVANNRNLCKFLNTLSGGGVVKTAFSLSSSKISGEFAMEANDKVFKNVYFSKSKTKIEWGFKDPFPKFTHEVELRVDVKSKTANDAGENKQSLYFNGAVTLSMKEGKLDFKMKGIWKEMFGLSRVHMGNTMLGLVLPWGSPTIVGGFSLGGEIAFGLDCYDASNNYIGEDHCIGGKGYASVDLTNPLENWFYAELKPFSFKRMYIAFVRKDKTAGDNFPKWLENALAFEKGLTGSLALSEKDVDFKSLGESRKLKVKKGFVFKGAISAFGNSADFNFELTLDKGKFTPNFEFKIDVQKAITIGKSFSLSKLSDKNAGPLIAAKFNKGVLSGEFDANIRLLGMEVGTKVKLDKEAFSFKMQGALFGSLFKGNVEVVTPLAFDHNKKAKFLVKGEIEIGDALNDFLKKVIVEAYNVIEEFKKENKIKSESKTDKILAYFDKIKFKDPFSIIDTFKICRKYSKKAKEAFKKKLKEASDVVAKKIFALADKGVDIFKLKKASFNFEINFGRDGTEKEAARALGSSNFQLAGTLLGKTFDYKGTWSFLNCGESEETFLGFVLDFFLSV